MKAKDLRDQTTEELEASLLDLQQELFSLRNELRQNKKLDAPHLLKNNRKDIARIYTVLSEKKRAS
ncbi:MAG: 50S ribosomal protein L29 [Waddliaceae bacterium]|jgi:large subunit ribosomal protein L29|nr:50S ribosomal protein L29 [Waddliaceae bacterium]MBT3578652.1 50S ribosomal protein L29 [Waddliaceae bacterium]MBT4445371.1 50S ribosomal protein L29 [Waddliaceae bacterium]MBT6928361.1 50S ribosomal protein L29 [Waddliaceae bacterium]MBT7265047.1 50S ribosomal protein L29 [Waddliaceae bacterium]